MEKTCKISQTYVVTTTHGEYHPAKMSHSHHNVGWCCSEIRKFSS